ncbi:uncharacterized protein LOC143025448 [Oratosquilla oratoria]|uniref:uncharacterized protein LOC143025448 n=1 Tax=Oratosquilla oratoria TaxID=337810 RepID=UPI003F76FBDA
MDTFLCPSSSVPFHQSPILAPLPSLPLSRSTPARLPTYALALSRPAPPRPAGDENAQTHRQPDIAVFPDADDDFCLLPGHTDCPQAAGRQAVKQGDLWKGPWTSATAVGLQVSSRQSLQQRSIVLSSL